MNRSSIAGFLVVLCAPSSGLAQPSEQDTAAARALFVEGRTLAAQGQWRDAADRLERARALRSSPAVLYNLALALSELGRLVEAAEDLREGLRDARANDPARAPSQHLLAEIEPRIGRLTVSLTGESRDVTLALDGRALSAALVDVAAPSDPGPHVVTALRGGAEVARVEVRVPEGGGVSAHLEVPAPAEAAAGTPVIAPAVTAPAEAPPHVVYVQAAVDRELQPSILPPPRPRNALWLVAGALVVGAGVLLDNAPASSRNHTLDPLDFIPVSLYALGASGAVLYFARF